MKVFDIKLSYNLVREDPSPKKLNSAELAVDYMKGAFDDYPEQESFWIIHLNRKNLPKGRQMLTLGTATATLVTPREVFRGAIMAGATAIIAVHNHPSGDPAPSSADINLTRLLREASRVVEIELLDHVIIGEPASDPTGLGYYSFRFAGLL